MIIVKSYLTNLTNLVAGMGVKEILLNKQVSKSPINCIVQKITA